VNKIGIKHLREIEKLLKSNPIKEYTKTEIRDIIGTNYWLIIDALSYLLHEKKIIKFKVNKIERYKWNPKWRQK